MLCYVQHISGDHRLQQRRWPVSGRVGWKRGGKKRFDDRRTWRPWDSPHTQNTHLHTPLYIISALYICIRISAVCVIRLPEVRSLPRRARPACRNATPTATALTSPSSSVYVAYIIRPPWERHRHLVGNVHTSPECGNRGICGVYICINVILIYIYIYMFILYTLIAHIYICVYERPLFFNHSSSRRVSVVWREGNGGPATYQSLIRVGIFFSRRDKYTPRVSYVPVQRTYTMIICIILL